MRIQWTKKKIEATTRKYKTIKEWRINEPLAYNAACKRKITSEVTKNLKAAIRPKNFWNKKTIIEAVRKFKSFEEWIKKDKSQSYSVATNLGLLNDPEVTGHLTKLEFRYIGHWTKDKILKDAKKYNSRSEWRKNSASAYQASLNKNIHKKATSHMKLLGSWFKRCLYTIEIKGKKKIYVGLTHNFKKRIYQHMNKNFAKYKKNQMIIKQITDYIDSERAVYFEDKLILQKKKAGFELLNKVKGGGLGGTVTPWTKKNIIKSAKKYLYKMEWKKNYPAAYQASKRYGYFETATKHMLIPERPRIWTKDKVINSASKYTYRNEWKKNAVHAYNAARSQGWLKEATSHMPSFKNFIWTKDKIIKDAKKYNSVTKWNKNSRGAYQASVNRDFFEEATKHMKSKNDLLKSARKWPKQKVLLDAKKYNSRSEWKKKSGGAYAAAKRYNYFEEATKHM